MKKALLRKALNDISIKPNVANKPLELFGKEVGSPTKVQCGGRTFIFKGYSTSSAACPLSDRAASFEPVSPDNMESEKPAKTKPRTIFSAKKKTKTKPQGKKRARAKAKAPRKKAKAKAPRKKARAPRKAKVPTKVNVPSQKEKAVFIPNAIRPVATFLTKTIAPVRMDLGTDPECSSFKDHCISSMENRVVADLSKMEPAITLVTLSNPLDRRTETPWSTYMTEGSSARAIPVKPREDVTQEYVESFFKGLNREIETIQKPVASTTSETKAPEEKAGESWHLTDCLISKYPAGTTSEKKKASILRDSKYRETICALMESRAKFLKDVAEELGISYSTLKCRAKSDPKVMKAYVAFKAKQSKKS